MAESVLTNEGNESIVSEPQKTQQGPASKNDSTIQADRWWYKDAIIYELHVKAFYDSNGDGIGDFQGLIEKLDYLQSLGINCVWLLPFYPSPLRDDGYDIADYRGVHPDYGTLRDFRQFIREAHRRGIRVVTELVINHTSNLHAWFQASRNAAPGSSTRDFYVWNDNDQKYQDARIIFTESEASNWTWDPVAKAYYWHRFFHHQPDLNFDNPHVRKAVHTIFRYWLDMGVDGMRLDAVPYLVERENTDCENLPETHSVLRELRQYLDKHYPECMLLAEANQWPADVRPYFGDGDECHMAFHFPLMPRIFMALRQEDRHPITEIMRQTPGIPESCQWALFLRNHDELTLEKVTDVERDYMHREYAADPRARLNLGIRRRLAPLMEHSRPRLELLTSLLFSLPGTPVIYYGDEIGMGDNLYLGDRNGVRTPMQWSGDRNAGFSRADFARLYSAPIMDPVDGYHAINVEAQQRDPSSLLNWMKQMIGLRKRFRVFGRGSMQFLHPRNRKILAYVREDEKDVILVVANLSRFAQPVDLDLSRFRGSIPVELLGHAKFPPISDLPYFLTLGPHSFYWFRLQKTEQLEPSKFSEPDTEAPVLDVDAECNGLFTGSNKRLLEHDILTAYLAKQKWFTKFDDKFVRSVQICDYVRWQYSTAPAFLVLIEVSFSEGGSAIYFLPIGITYFPEANQVRERRPNQILAPIKVNQRDGLLHDATLDDEFCTSLCQAIETSREISMKNGTVVSLPFKSYADIRGTTEDPLPVHQLEHINTNFCVQFGGRMILKLFRQVESGANPDLEIGRYLSEQGVFQQTPKAAGSIEYRQRGSEPKTLGLLQSLAKNQGNGWDYTIDEVHRFFDRVSTAGQNVDPSISNGRSWYERSEAEPSLPIMELIGSYLQAARTLGQRTGELHNALAADTDSAAFAPESATMNDLRGLSDAAVDLTHEVFATLDRNLGWLQDTVVDQAYVLFSQRSRIMRMISEITTMELDVKKIRIHGDYHLSEVLWTENDFVILDYEGDASQTIEERRAKQFALKDVACMVRSFEYAAYEGLFKFVHSRPEELDRLEPWAQFWKRWVGGAFLNSYRKITTGAIFLPKDQARFQTFLSFFVLERALGELLHELNHRPDCVRIPLRGVLTILDADSTLKMASPPKQSSNGDGAPKSN